MLASRFAKYYWLLLILSCYVGFDSFVAAVVMSQTLICKDGNCSKFYTGILSLRNEETVSLEGKAKTGRSTRDVTVTISKSRVLFLYDLKYEIDVFSDIKETAFHYPYRWKMRHYQESDYRKQCSADPEYQDCEAWGGNRSGPDVSFHDGQCCWCESVTFFTSSGPRRSRISCGAFDTMQWKPFIAKYCPKIIGPWYSSLSIGAWKWHFDLNLSLSWYDPGQEDSPESDSLLSEEARIAEYECYRNALQRTSGTTNAPVRLAELLASTTIDGKTKMIENDETFNGKENSSSFHEEVVRSCSRERSRVAGLKTANLQLNYSSPQLFSEDYDLHMKIVGSQPQIDALPPPLNDHFLFIPTYPASHPIVRRSLLKNGCGYLVENDDEKNVSDNNEDDDDDIENDYVALDEEEEEELVDDGRPNAVFPPSQVLQNLRMQGKLPVNKTQLDPNPFYKEPSNCLSEALLIPSTFVDLTGRTCNTIGVSLEAWNYADGVGFCNVQPGHCLANQIGKLRAKDKRRVAEGKRPRFQVGPERLQGFSGAFPRLFSENFSDGPIDVRLKNMNYKFGWTYPYEHVTTVEIQLGASNIALMQTNSPAEIHNIQSSLGCEAFASNCIADVIVSNNGLVESRYIVSIPYCLNALTGRKTEDINPVSPLGKTISPNRSSTFRFFINSNVDRQGYYSCKVALSDTEGRRLDHGLFNISFFDLERSFQGQQQSLWPAEVEVVLSESNDTASLGFFSVFSSFGNPFKNFDMVGECNCSLINVLCIAMNFWGCIKWIKRVVWTGIGCATVFASFYLCGPSAFGLKYLFRGLNGFVSSRRQKKYEADGTENYDDGTKTAKDEDHKDDESEEGDEEM